MIPMSTKEIIKEEEGYLEKILEGTRSFTEFKIQIAGEDTVELSLDLRMKRVLTGLSIGISPKTVLMLLRIDKPSLDLWFSDPQNKTDYEQALAMADAYLEAVVYSAATFKPDLALRLLEKRNAKRWQLPDIDDEIEKFGEAAKQVVKGKLTMSEMLKTKTLNESTDILQ